MAGTAADLKAKLILVLEDEMSKAIKKATDNAVDGAQKTEKGWKKAYKNINEAAQKSFQKIQKGQALMRKGAMTIFKGAAISAPLVAVVKQAADFEHTMQKVKSVMGSDITAPMEDLAKAAMKAGRDTAWSAGQSAEAILDLKKAGTDASTIIGGGLTAALNLASASNLSAAESANFLTDVGNTFAMKTGPDLIRISDIFAGTAANVSAEVSQLRESFTFAGQAARISGLGIGQLVTGLGVLHNNSLKATVAGTSFNSMLLKGLNPQTDKAAATMAKFGISFKDSFGEVKDLRDIAENLKRSLKGLKDTAKAKVLQDVFGKIGLKAAAIFSREGAAGIDELTKKIKGLSAAEIAVQRLDSVSGAMTILKGSIETASIELGTHFLPEVKELTRDTIKIVNGVAQWASENKGLVLAMGKGVLMISAATIAFGALQIAAGAAMIAMSPVTIIAAGLGSIAFIVWDISSGFSEMGKDIKSAFSSLEMHALTLKKMAGFAVKIYSLGLIDTGFGAKDQARLEELQRGSGIRTTENSKSFTSMISDFGKASLPGSTSTQGDINIEQTFTGGNGDIQKVVSDTVNQILIKNNKMAKRSALAGVGG